MKSEKLFSLVISYRPDMDILDSVLESLKNQVDFILLVDNGSENSSDLKQLETSEKVEIIYLSENLGIAKATNIGLDLLKSRDCDYVLLSDQDTVYPNDYVKNFTEYIDCGKNLDKIAAFSPVFFDVNSNEYKPLYVQKKHRIKKVPFSDNTTYIFQSIASGLIIDIKKYLEIGGMNEDLFIDYVDFEWCWRVNKAGYKILCLPQLKIEHHLGDGSVAVVKKKISEHNSIRYYYITRNTFYLSLYSPYLEWRMKLQLFMKACLYPFGYSIFCKQHLKNTKYTLRGMFDGIFKRLGKADWKMRF